MLGIKQVTINVLGLNLAWTGSWVAAGDKDITKYINKISAQPNLFV